MKPDRWRQVDKLFEAALEHEDPVERAKFLDQACEGDPSLRREVEKMLRFDAAAQDFIETPAFEVATELMTGQPVAAPISRGSANKKSTERSSQASLSSGSIDDAVFIPGDVLADRYRIVGLLGRGGMGEVYRADDLKLKQPVALKFLPEKLSDDGAALARFYQEVSVARQISHRHVCRVYDVGESGGQHFISMEFVRGEELASLLKRIGHLPPDKAVEIARQLSAGLAAIHDKGVLHRDLKPANVMIDERGDVRITDFGIAALAEEMSGQGAIAGTPAYMSPEQLEGNGLTVKSDLYSLGLVIHELFSGKRVFEAASLPELLRLRRNETRPSSLAESKGRLDPLVERVIFRCLERDPKLRPASALEVAAALPGGDPLQAALAAGETPSPEMVAAAPKQGSLKPLVALALLAALFVGLLLMILMAGRVALHRLVPLRKSPDALKERAGEVARKLGYDGQPVDTAHGFVLDFENLSYLRDKDASPDRWDRLGTGQPPVIAFWYRQSPRYLEPYNNWEIAIKDPPHTVSGMLAVNFDTTGRLIYFEAVPPQQPDAALQSAGAQPDWSTLFQEAGLDLNNFQATQSLWTPPQHSDLRVAWNGAYPNRPQEKIRIEAASYLGKVVYFELVLPWQTPARQTPYRESAADSAGFILLLAFYFVPLILGALLAWRNLRRGLGDRRGAFRLALFVFALRIIQWVFWAHHVPTPSEVSALFLTGLQAALFLACFVGIMYLALEPFLRRRRPEWLISWSRLLAGDWRDPLVGRDILVGGLLGVCLMMSFYLDEIATVWLGQPLSIPTINSGLLYSLGLLGLNGFVPLFVNQVTAAILFTFIAAFLMLFLGILLRSKRFGAVAAWVLLSALSVLVSDNKSPVSMVFALVGPTIIVLAMTRFGLLTTIFAFLFVHLSVFFPVTTELSAWYASSFILDLIVLLALAIYGFFISLAGQPLFRGEFLEE